jgi:hypothetical protein
MPASVSPHNGGGISPVSFARDNQSPSFRIALMITKNIGMLVLAIYLILVGIIGIFGVSLGAASILLPILALIAGILILIGK